ncbi:MAG: M24 family metallopeptidase [Theionarchaea archaeon]|nr:M24 family metallopeptidase [Theionarchaea archaeon]
MAKIADFVFDIIDEAKSEVDLEVSISTEEYPKRWEMLQQAMRDRNVDLAYACGSELDRSDAAWLAGAFDPIIERYGVLVPSEGTPAILAGSEGGHVMEEAAERSGAKIFLLQEFQISDEEYRHAHFTTLEEVLSSLGAQSAKKVALLSSPEFLPHSQFKIFESRFGDGVVYDPILELVKYEKTPAELRVCGQANLIADAAMRAMLASLEPGATELEVAGVGDFVMKELGAGRTGFPTIVTAGDRNYTVIGPATNNHIANGDMIALGVSPTFNGYHGVVRRTVKMGELTEGQREFLGGVEGLYDVVMKATIEAAEANLPSNHIDRAGKEYLANLKLRTLKGDTRTPLEPYTFIHNTGCSECQEGYGAVTPHTESPLAHRAALMIDVALLGFKERGKPIFEVLYGVIEDAFWKMDTRIGVYNTLPLNVQELVGNLQDYERNPYHCPIPTG